MNKVVAGADTSGSVGLPVEHPVQNLGKDTIPVIIPVIMVSVDPDLEPGSIAKSEIAAKPEFQVRVSQSHNQLPVNKVVAGAPGKTNT